METGLGSGVLGFQSAKQITGFPKTCVSGTPIARTIVFQSAKQITGFPKSIFVHRTGMP